MSKQKGKNAFFFYLLHTQSLMRREGKNLSINDNNLREIANQKWKNMSTEERKPFDDKSKAEKEEKNNVIQIQPKNYSEIRSQNLRQFSEQCDEMDDESGREQYLDQIIKYRVKACKTKEELINASFFIVSTNVMIKTNENEFLPLEIGITQYSIKDGIQLTYHEFIDAGPIPQGYARLAQEFERDFHKIPSQNFYLASNDYQRVVEEIIQILDNSRFTNSVTDAPTPMIVFCREDAILQNRGVFEWLANKYRQYVPSFKWDLEVLDLVNLLYHITNQVNQRVVPAVGEDKLTSSAFDYSPNTNCDFHEEQDNRFCAQGVARRLCYMLSEVLCPIFNINPTLNHLPPKRENVIAETYTPVFHNYKQMPSYRFNRDAHASNADTNWAPLPTVQSRPESSASNQPQSRPSESSTRMGIGRGTSSITRNNNDSSDGSRPPQRH